VGSRANLWHLRLLHRLLPRCASRDRRRLPAGGRQLPAGGEGLWFRLCRSGSRTLR
jgi:hypothetical protein